MMMIKLIKVEQLEEKRFSILVSINAKEKKYFVQTKEHLFESIDEPIWVIVPDDESFFDIWGQDSDFRREVASSIDSLRKKAIPELQAA